MMFLINRFAPARRVMVLAAIIAAVCLTAPSALASMAINLVFPDGTNSMTVTAANQFQDIPVLVYATVTGANPVTLTPGATTGNFDGFDYAFYDIVDSVGSGGALMGGIDNGAANPNYAPTLNSALTLNNAGSQAGTVQNITGDGIADLGSYTVMVQAAKPRAGFDIFDNFNAGAPNIIIGGTNDNSVSFLLETIYFQTPLSMSIGQSTTLSPLPFTTSIPYVQSNYFMDDPTIPTFGSPPGARYTSTVETAGTSVTFTVVPEPASATTVCLLAAGLLTRRRNRIADRRL